MFICMCKYSDVPIIRPHMVLVESDLNREQVSLMRHIYIEKKCFSTETNGINSKDGLDF